MRRDGIVTTVRQQAKGSRAMLWAENEILFFEWNGTPGAPSSGAGLKALDLAQLAAATARYVDHGATLEYLLRSASRLREKNCEGFGLVTSDGSLRGCVWGTVSDGFVLPEVKVKVDALPEDSVILFDRWTPPDAQDHGYGVQLLRLAAGRMREAGKKPWTFCLARDVDTIENLEKSGFHLRRSLVLRRRFGWQSIKSKNLRSDESVAAEVSARVG
jgi:GNAT superfamily N-acetyltransferase